MSGVPLSKENCKGEDPFIRSIQRVDWGLINYTDEMMSEKNKIYSATSNGWDGESVSKCL